MHEVVEEFVQRILAENPEVIKILDEVAENKKNKAQKKFTNEDVESIFSILENDNPFGKGDKDDVSWWQIRSKFSERW